MSAFDALFDVVAVHAVRRALLAFVDAVDEPAIGANAVGLADVLEQREFWVAPFAFVGLQWVAFSAVLEVFAFEALVVQFEVAVWAFLHAVPIQH